MKRGVTTLLIILILTLSLVPITFAQSCQKVWEQCDQECNIKDWSKATQKQRGCTDACDNKNNCGHKKSENTIIYDIKLLFKEINIALTFNKEKKENKKLELIQEKDEELNKYGKEKNRELFVRAKQTKQKLSKPDTQASTHTTAYEGQAQEDEAIGGGEINELEDTQDSSQQQEDARPEEQLPKTQEEAIETQVEVAEEVIKLESLNDLENSELCKLSLSKTEIASSEKAEGTAIVDAALEGEVVYLACDQYERHGIGGDKLYGEKISSSLRVEVEDCDYGRVTTPTVYFVSISDGIQGSKDYCSAPLTVMPKKEDVGKCFGESTIQKMKDECTNKGTSYNIIPDGNGCDTIYCGYVSCTPEATLEKAWDSCLEKEMTPARYSETVEGIDWPCAQVRCSQCTAEEELAIKEAKCIESGTTPVKEKDYNTNCDIIYCVENGIE
jgi:hypothetical protein